MKVLHIDTGREWRGGQAQINNLLTHFPEGKLENHLLAPPESPLTSSPRRPISSSRIHTHPLRGEWDITAAWKIYRLHKNYNFNLIHAHSSHALGIAWLASIFFKLPPFIETRRLETPVAKNFISKKKYFSAEHHIANSKTVKETLAQCGLPEEKITFIPSGINLEKIEATEPDHSIIKELGLDPEKPIIGNVGALSPQKDQETFIKAALRVHPDHPQAQFVIAGEGELRPELEKLIRENNAEEYIKLAGFIENIFGFMKTLDLFVLTSLYEGLCGTILQAMACEIPVITSNVKGSRQIIRHGKTCYAVDIGDIDGFEAGIKKYLNSKEYFSGFIPEARSIAAQYDYNQLASKMFSFYSKLIPCLKR